MGGGRGGGRGGGNKEKANCQERAKMFTVHAMVVAAVAGFFSFLNKPCWCHHHSPNQQRWHAKRKLCRNTNSLRTHFCTFACRLACSVGAYQQKIPASELGRKFIKSALLAGHSTHQVDDLQVLLVSPLRHQDLLGDEVGPVGGTSLQGEAQKLRMEP